MKYIFNQENKCALNPRTKEEKKKKLMKRCLQLLKIAKSKFSQLLVMSLVLNWEKTFVEICSAIPWGLELSSVDSGFPGSTFLSWLKLTVN